jgi:hypothetical protein
LSAPGVALVAVCGLASAFACGKHDDPPTASTPRAVALAIKDGNDQSGPAGSVVAQPLRATATDGKATPVPGAIVKFRVTRGAETGTTVTDTVAVAGFDGTASIWLRLGTALDTSIVEAFLSDQPSVVARFRATATPPPRLDAVIPTSFSTGDTVRMRGQFFNVATAGNTAFFGSAKGRVVRGDADTSLTVVVPPCVSAGAVSARVVVGSVATNAIATMFVGAGGLLALQPLEGITVSGTELGSCMQLAGAGASYLLVPQSAASSNGTRQVDFALTATAATLGAEAAPRLPIIPYGGAASIGGQFDVALREREARLVDDARASGALRPEPSVLGRQTLAAPPALGSERSFQVLSKFDGTAFKRITARARYVGSHIVLYVDVDQPPGSFTDAELRVFGDLFDQTLYDLDVRAFGSESDIDANGRVLLIMTPVVNALTSASDCSTQGFITGFHYGLDLLPTQPNSNRGEIFYALVPDVGGTRSCEHTKADVERVVPATFVHEFQHMISFGQHVLARGGASEALWLNEGLSHIAEELAGKTYEAKFPPPLGRTDPNQLFPDSAQGYLTPNMRNAQSFLQRPGTTSVIALTGGGTLAERGGSWLFLRWLGDQKGESIYGRLVQTSRTGVANVEDKADETFAGLFGDFTTAVYTDSLPGVARTSVPTRLRLTSRNLRQIFKRFSDIDQSGRTPVFPFTPVGFAAGDNVSGTMVQGSMTYYQLTTRPNEASVGLRFSRGDLSPFASDDQVQIGIFRLP